MCLVHAMRSYVCAHVCAQHQHVCLDCLWARVLHKRNDKTNNARTLIQHT